MVTERPHLTSPAAQVVLVIDQPHVTSDFVLPEVDIQQARLEQLLTLNLSQDQAMTIPQELNYGTQKLNYLNKQAVLLALMRLLPAHFSLKCLQIFSDIIFQGEFTGF